MDRPIAIQPKVILGADHSLAKIACQMRFTVTRAAWMSQLNSQRRIESIGRAARPLIGGIRPAFPFDGTGRKSRTWCTSAVPFARERSVLY